MKIEDFEIGMIYRKGSNSNLYKCVEVTPNWILVIEYSDKHHIATCMFWNQEYLDDDFNQNIVEVKEDAWYYRLLFDDLEIYGDDLTTLHYNG